MSESHEYKNSVAADLRSRKIRTAQSRIRFTLKQLTIPEAATRLAVTRQTVVNWANGTHPMRPSAVMSVLALNRSLRKGVAVPGQLVLSSASVELNPNLQKKDPPSRGEFQAILELTSELQTREKLELARTLIAQVEVNQ